MEYNVSIDLGRFLAEVNPQMYSDPTCVVDELVQNAQRAGARNLRAFQVHRYTKGDEVVIIEDDGCGLKDPNDLLRIARTGWSHDVVETEAPFGMGFWFTTAFTSSVLVRSGTWALALNSHRLRQSRDVRQVVSVHRGQEFCSGFTVELRSPRERLEWIPSEGDPPSRQHEMLVRAWDRFSAEFANKLASVVEFVPFESVRLASTSVYTGEIANRECCAEVPLEQVPCGRDVFDASPQAKYARPVRFSFGQGVIWPTRDWGWTPGVSWSGVKYYLSGREVCTEFRDFGGIIHVNLGALTLRAPDRKAFVANQALTDAHLALQEAAHTMYLGLCSLAEVSDFVNYDSVLVRNLRDEDLLDVPVTWEAPEVEASSGSEILREDIPEGVSLEHDSLPTRGGAAPTGSGELPKRMPGRLISAARKLVAPVVTTLRQLPDLVFWYSPEAGEEVVKSVAQLRELGYMVILARTKLAARALATLPKLRESARVLELGVPSWAPQMVFTFKPSSLGRYEALVTAAVKVAASALGVATVEVGEVYGSAEILAGGILIPVGRPIRVSAGRVDGVVYLDTDVLASLVPLALVAPRPCEYLAFRLLAPIASIVSGKDHAYRAMDEALHTLALQISKEA